MDEPELSDTEGRLAALWCEVLQLAPRPSRADNFFELGGDSMTMTMLEYRIKEELTVDIPVGSLLRAPTLRELSTLIDELDCRAVR